MKNLFLAAAIGFGAMACTDRATENPDPGSNPQLPAITQTGANTFGAMINGKVMVPRNSIGYVPPGSNHYAVKYLKDNSYEQLEAGDAITSRGYIYIYIYIYKITQMFILYLLDNILLSKAIVLLKILLLQE